MREDLTRPSTTVRDINGAADGREHPAEAPSPARLAWLRTVPLLVLVLTLLHGALLAMFTVLYPPYIGPDEPQHVDMAFALTRSVEWPAPGERALSLGVARTSDPFYRRGARRRVGPYLERDAVPRGGRPSLCALGGNAPSPTPPRYPNQMVQHAPLYYAIEAAVLKVAPGECAWPYDRLVWLMRGVSALLLLPLPLLAWATTRRIAGEGPVAQAAAALPLAVPGLIRVGALVNNDDLLILLGALLGLLLAGVVTGDLRRRTAALVGVVLAAALLTKFNAVIFAPVIVAAYAVAWWRGRGPLPWRQLLIVGGLSLLGAWWWLRNLILYGALQPHGWSGWALRDFESHGSIGQSHPFDSFWPVFVRLLERRFWSALGVIDRPELPWIVIRGLTVLLLVGVLAALVHGRARGGRASLAVLAAPAVLAFLALGLWDWLYYARVGLRGGIQGRYTYPALPPLVAVVAVGYGGLLGRFRRLLPLLACVLALGVQLFALRAILRSFWLPSPSGDRLTDLRVAFGALLAWSPWPPAATLAPFVLAAVLGLGAVAVATLVAVRTGAAPAAG
jgi:small subunit ribosomal protein S36